MENTPPVAIFTPRPERLPEGNLEGREFFQSGSVLEITLQTAGVYRQYINSIHPRSIKKNERYSDDGNLGRPLWERQFASATAEGKFEASPPQFFGKGILLQNRDQYLI